LAEASYGKSPPASFTQNVQEGFRICVDVMITASPLLSVVAVPVSLTFPENVPATSAPETGSPQSLWMVTVALPNLFPLIQFAVSSSTEYINTFPGMQAASVIAEAADEAPVSFILDDLSLALTVCVYCVPG